MKKLAELTPEEKRIIIAEWEGHQWYWRTCGGNPDGSFKWRMNLAYPPEEGIGKAWKGCAGETHLATREEVGLIIVGGDYDNHAPDYLKDINAIVKACELSEEQQYTFIEHLERLGGNNLAGRIWRLVNATASQRTDALILTIGAATL